MTVTLTTCLIASGIILGYGVLLSKIIPTRVHWLSNTIFAIVLFFGAQKLNISNDQLGIGLRYIASGILVALSLSLSIIVLTLILASIPKFKSYFLSQHSILKTKNSRIAYETMFRIPLVTAFFEEFVFRGFLLALFLSVETTTAAVISSSIVFGLWHVFPAINGMNQDHYKAIRGDDASSKARFVCFNIASTAVAGLFFSWLRIAANSIIAPWLLHWTINAGGIVAVLFAKNRSRA